MAEKVTVELVDDLDGSPADEKILFALGGSQYEIDLNTKNAEAFHKVLKPYIDAARPPSRLAPGPGRPRAAAKRGAPRGGTEDYPRETVRSWARAQGLDVGVRGRIKGEIVEKWKAAGSPEA